jgi:dihydropyrimidinase
VGWIGQLPDGQRPRDRIQVPAIVRADRQVRGKVDTVIKNGLVVNGERVALADVAVSDGVIEEVGSDLGARNGAEIIDASGKYVLPGIIDVHVHFDARPNHVDDFHALSRTAAWGGTTTIIAFLFIRSGRGLAETLSQAIEEGERKSFIDFSFHPALIDAKNQLDQIPDAVKLGAPSFKMVMTYAGQMASDEVLFEAMRRIADIGGLAMVHCENGPVIEYLQDECRRQGRFSAADWVATQPIALETEAINRAIAIASVADCSLYVPHISTGAALGPVMRAWEEGQTVYAETCPTYLLLTHEEVVNRGDIAKIGPPLRGEEDRESLWEAVADGIIDVVATDHVAKDKKGSQDVLNAPFGAPGAETLLTVMYDGAINGGRITLCRLVELLCENPAKIFGLYPRKGIIEVGSDADVVIVDPNLRKTLTHKSQHTNATYTLYEGRECLGTPVLSLQRGRVVFERGELKAEPGQGQFLFREPS